MRTTLWVSPLCVAAVLAATIVSAQTAAIAPRELGRVLATSPMTFAATRPQVIALSDGRVLVADPAKQVVVLFDSAFAHPKVILDSTAGRNTSFTPGSFLATFRGDATFFFDRSASTLVVITPSGGLGRTMAPPITSGSSAGRGGTPPYVAGFTSGGNLPASSPTLGLVFHAAQPMPPPPRFLEGQPDVVIRLGDSILVVRMDFGTRKLDTVAMLSAGGGAILTYMARGGMSVHTGALLFPYLDDAVVTSDGSVALFIARDYRIDRVTAGGTRTTGARLSYPWTHITEAARTRIVDSINGARQRSYDSTVAKRAADSARTGVAPTTTAFSSGPGGERISRQIPMPAPRPPDLMAPSEVPDYLPPTARDAVLADGDNNVWLRPIPPSPAAPGAVWEVIDQKGELTARVRIPDGRTIVGFGAGGIVYLALTDAGVTTLQKVAWRAP